MDCRLGCGACCVAITITDKIPGYDKPIKAAGERCIHLDDQNLCKIFGHPDRPKTCENFKASLDFCGSTNEEAFQTLAQLEELTKPL